MKSRFQKLWEVRVYPERGLTLWTQLNFYANSAAAGEGQPPFRIDTEQSKFDNCPIPEGTWFTSVLYVIHKFFECRIRPSKSSIRSQNGPLFPITHQSRDATTLFEHRQTRHPLRLKDTKSVTSPEVVEFVFHRERQRKGDKKKRTPVPRRKQSESNLIKGM